MHWWKRSLSVQFIGFTLVALVASQILSLYVSHDEQEKAVFAAYKSEFLTRMASLTRLAESIPVELREQAVLASETSYSRFWITDSEQPDATQWRRQAAEQLSRDLANFVALPQHSGAGLPTAINASTRDALLAATSGEPWSTPSEVAWSLPQAAKFTYINGRNGFGLAVRLSDGKWLNSAYYKVSANSWWNSQTFYSLGLTAFFMSIIGIAAAHRIARPLRRLAASAEAIGRGENVPPLPEEGTDDIRQTTEAFNRMQARLFRFVEDRTHMLAAIGHDLRTPLTSLRLRAELVTDLDVQQRMLATIDEIQTMTEATIAFARGESAVEDTRTVDLNALIGSLCDNLAEMNQPVTYLDGEKSPYRCRPDGIRRAVRNIVENALRYGGAAEVYLRQTPHTMEVVVEDRGPGIPANMHEKVFAPFYRLEASRNRDTGGVGLGLAIARAIIRHHGGDIVLVNREPGLQVTISLPKASAAVIRQKPWKLRPARRDASLTW